MSGGDQERRRRRRDGGGNGRARVQKKKQKMERSPSRDRLGGGVMWTDAHTPKDLEDLVIRRNKVQELVEWMHAPADAVCMLSGPAGCGKSTMVRVVAAACGREVVDYVGKVQVDRSVLYSSDAHEYRDLYESKLEAYESFCKRAWMPTFGASATVVVLDDVPIAVGDDQMERLVRATLMLLSRSKKTLLVMTEISSKDASEHQGYSHGTRWEECTVPKALIRAIESSYRPTKISLNPIPKATMVKHLSSIIEDEGVVMSKTDIQAIAEQSQGDLSHAILTLQFAARGMSKARTRQAAGTPGSVNLVSCMMRDSSLSLFHGLGKLLYNKRIGMPPEASDMDRAPMDGFHPEETVHASGLSGPSVTAFLHENILSFVDDEYIGDVAECLEQISFSDVVSSQRDVTPYYGTVSDDPDGSRGLSDLMASIISSRGICFWNVHPAPRSWKPLRAPVAFKVEHARRTNAQRLRRAAAVHRIAYGGSVDESTFESMATEMLPYLRSFNPFHVQQQPQEWDRYWQGAIHHSTVIWSNPRQHGIPESGTDCPATVEDDLIEDPIES